VHCKGVFVKIGIIFFLSAVCVGNLPAMELVKEEFGRIKFSRKLRYDSDLETVTKFITEHKSLINIHDRDGLTLLHRQVFQHKPKCVAVLLQNGADPNIKGRSGWEVPLMYACEDKQIESVAALLRYDADANAKLGNKSLLVYVAEQGCTEIVALLLKYGANVNQLDKETGYTALHTAIKHYNKLMCDLLIEWGAHWDITDKKNRTVIEIAKSRGWEVVESQTHETKEKIKRKPISEVEKEVWEQYRRYQLETFLFVMDTRESYSSLTTLLSCQRK
jgi:ankyrin repeat protein